MKLYVMVTQDELQLPEIVTASVQDMVRQSGISDSTIFRHIRAWKAGKKQYPLFVELQVDEDPYWSLVE